MSNTVVLSQPPLTTTEVASIAKVSVKTVRRWIAVGNNGKSLPHLKTPGGAYRIPPEALQDFLGWSVSQPQ